VDEAFAALERAGYHLGSAYTASKGEQSFLYRDALWHGADMVALGVSSFGHLAGVHYQNEHAFEPYLTRIEGGALPIHRAYAMSAEERFRREWILQMKLGQVDLGYFRRKFGVDPLQHFAEPLAQHASAGWLEHDHDTLRATRAGLMQIDVLLYDYFLPEHRGARYA
jgi:oxygen-independent coproporphyrinogen-3 oxidase